jgi:hypothetical protein
MTVRVITLSHLTMLRYDIRYFIVYSPYRKLFSVKYIDLNDIYIYTHTYISKAKFS